MPSFEFRPDIIWKEHRAQRGTRGSDGFKRVDWFSLVIDRSRHASAGILEGAHGDHYTYTVFKVGTLPTHKWTHVYMPTNHFPAISSVPVCLVPARGDLKKP